ncbi:SAC3/GANP/Nin1/mts3/eIF-3 p25 family-domain-containing protein [Chaetomidium leptoderma]|uniref:SAC3/GANP/Nin1/mts3/eIF-3 p25 family-domain-containing protein n=1 Tax=Chaetomidium leptoderma TaxID=669021 RepID=A0AAN6VNU3_9PEZI|nr:SAC3/GANP/Nin1/mts3/eIF-3 p25 family-domain-containing protein [Chaetomidium leptoderma]
MAAPANNPFGSPPPQVFHNPFGASTAGQSTSMFGKPVQNTFAAPAPNSNAFGAPAANPFGAPANNPFGEPAPGSRPSSAGNPFGAPSSRQASPSVAHNPFSKPSAQAQVKNHFGATQGVPGSGRSPSPFGARAPPTGPSSQSSAPGAADTNAMGRRNKPTGGKPPATNTAGGFGGRGGHSQGPQRATPFAGTKPFSKQPNGQGTVTNASIQPGGRNKQQGGQDRYQPPLGQHGKQLLTTAGGPSERTKQLSTFAFNYANKLYDHLKKENITPPQGLADPGDPDKRGAVESLKESYKKYRARVYATLRKVDLIDDPEKRRKLEDALPFKGICEDMCPDFERVYRIAEYDVKKEEKETRPDGLSRWPDTSLMVKKFGRSAAGQDAPLPMDVRSVDALRRTTDYLFNELLQSESNLPSMHNFLWDRTRAVRKDFTFHSQKSANEMKDMVYCFETITRFHATALHLLSRKGVANDDFDQKQEIEQLGRTILSLIEAYDVCRDKRVHCENEPEFRAYYLLLNAHDPSIARRIPAWGKEYWFESEEVQTALSLIQSMDDVREPKGPIKPRRPTTLSDTSFTNYFSIVEDSRVSYTMACIAEVHFTTVRQGILRNLVRGYARHRDAPRTITAADLNMMLRFDTAEEAVEFAELHDFEFSTWVPEGKNRVPEPYLLLNNKKKHVPSPRVRQAFSGKVIERKRKTQSLPHVIYNTIFEEAADQLPSAESSPDGLFVSRSAASEDLASDSPTFLPPAQPSVAPAAAPSPFGSAAMGSPFTIGAPAPAFPGFPASQPSAPTAPGPFSALSQPTTQAQAGKSPFSFLNQPPASSTAGTTANPPSVQGQPAQLGQTTAFPPAAVKPSEVPSPFASLKGPGSAALPSLAQATQQQPSASFPFAPSFLGNTTPKPATSFPSTQDVTKPAESVPSTSIPGSTPLVGTSPFSTPSLARPPEQQATTAEPAVPSIFVSPPSATAPAPATQGAPLGLFTAPSQPPGQPPSAFTSSTPAVSALSKFTAAPPIPQPPPKRDLIGDFTKWFVTGDQGLMEQFAEEMLQNMLWDVWQDFGRQEAERKWREQDEESWRIAREHQNYRLRVKYFYRWRKNARSLATKRILRQGKEKMRVYREQQRATKKQQQEEKEQAEREARRAAKRQLMEDGHRLSLLASSTQRRGSVAYSTDHNPEEQLLASGIFSGLREDPRSVARRVVREDGWALASASRSFRYAESELELEPARSPRDSPDASSVGGGGKREGWKTRSLREKFGMEPRRSLSASGSVANGGSFMSSSSRFRQSLPGNANNKTTNFSSSSRKRSAEEESDDEPGAKRQSVLYGTNGVKTNNGLAKSRHWDLRARGFVPLPDGNWLPEAIAMSSSSATRNNNKEEGSSSRTTRGQRYTFASGASSDVDMTSDAGHHHHNPHHRAPSPTPSDLHLRLARLKKPRAHHQGHGHGHGHSVDLGRFAMTEEERGGILSTSPPHPPPFGGGSIMPPPARRHSGGKRKRRSSDDIMHDGPEEEERELSPPSAKKKAILLDVGAGAGPGREETNAMVENTRRMLRELREFMDRSDRDEQREDVYLEGY